MRDLAPDPDTLVVVNCAGRTRSIIGAQSLINAGVPNRVAALANGTMGWTLAGHGSRMARRACRRRRARRVGHGRSRRRRGSPPGSACASHPTTSRVFARPKNARSISATCAARGIRDGAHARHALDAGGQLVQATDPCLGTRNTRVVLIDDDGVRATMTASWLIQMGWREAFVLRDGLRGELERGPERTEVLGLDERGTEAAMDAPTLNLRLERGDSPGPRLRRQPRLPRRSHPRRVVAHPRTPRSGSEGRAPCPRLRADLTRWHPGASRSADLRQHVRAPVAVLAGGTEAWRAAGLPLSSGAEHMAGALDDVHLRPYDRPPEQVEQAMRDYLRWETALLPQLARDGSLVFPSFS